MHHRGRVAERNLVAEPREALIVVDRALDFGADLGELAFGLEPAAFDARDRVVANGVVGVGPRGHRAATAERPPGATARAGTAPTMSHSRATARVKRPGATVSARAGYSEPRPFASSSAVERSFSAADAISAEIPVRDLPAVVTAQAFAGKGSPEATVQVSLPGSSLSAGKSDRIPVEIYVYAYDEAGKVADFAAETATLDLSQVGARLREGGLRFFTQFRLRPGTYRLHALARNGATGAMGFDTRDLVVPDFAPGKPLVVAPLAVGSGAGVVLRVRASRSGDEVAFPYRMGADTFLPDPSPSVERTRELKLCLYTYAIGANARFGGQILEASGKPLGAADLSLLGHSPPDELGRSTYVLAFRPGNLGAGNYILRVVAQDPASGVARQATTPVEVR